MDWRDCSDIEVVPGKVGGRPVIKYGRTPGQTHAGFPVVPVDTLLKILAFASRMRTPHGP